MLKKAIVASALMFAAVSHGDPPAKGKEPAAKPREGMSMMDMMGKSDKGCMATHDSLETLTKVVQDALKSDDKAKKKAALQKVDAHFAQMKDHMATCMDMMHRMGGMMGGNAPDSGTYGHEMHHPK